MAANFSIKQHLIEKLGYKITPYSLQIRVLKESQWYRITGVKSTCLENYFLTQQILETHKLYHKQTIPGIRT